MLVFLHFQPTVTENKIILMTYWIIFRKGFTIWDDYSRLHVVYGIGSTLVVSNPVFLILILDIKNMDLTLRLAHVDNRCVDLNSLYCWVYANFLKTAANERIISYL